MPNDIHKRFLRQDDRDLLDRIFIEQRVKSDINWNDIFGVPKEKGPGNVVAKIILNSNVEFHKYLVKYYDVVLKLNDILSNLKDCNEIDKADKLIIKQIYEDANKLCHAKMSELNFLYLSLDFLWLPWIAPLYQGTTWFFRYVRTSLMLRTGPQNTVLDNLNNYALVLSRHWRDILYANSYIAYREDKRKMIAWQKFTGNYYIQWFINGAVVCGAFYYCFRKPTPRRLGACTYVLCCLLF